MQARALGRRVWGRRVARLPARGILLCSTDLQGNRGDYEALKAVYAREKAAGGAAILCLQGDLVHGPSPDLQEPGAWPDHLGTPYRDESAALLLDFEQWTRREAGFALLGNHEHAHIGGPVVPKFYDDEAAVLDAALGGERARMHAFLRTFPLVAVAPCGIVLTHAAPRATERDARAFERLGYAGYERVPIVEMVRRDTVGALLWARNATAEQARALLAALLPARHGEGLVAYGHDVVHEGYEKVGAEQICFSTSYALDDANKVYLRLDLGARYRSTADLREGREIRHLHSGPRPGPGPGARW